MFSYSKATFIYFQRIKSLYSRQGSVSCGQIYLTTPLHKIKHIESQGWKTLYLNLRLPTLKNNLMHCPSFFLFLRQYLLNAYFLSWPPLGILTNYPIYNYFVLKVFIFLHQLITDEQFIWCCSTLLLEPKVEQLRTAHVIFRIYIIRTLYQLQFFHSPRKCTKVELCIPD